MHTHPLEALDLVNCRLCVSTSLQVALGHSEGYGTLSVRFRHGESMLHPLQILLVILPCRDTQRHIADPDAPTMST